MSIPTSLARYSYPPLRLGEIRVLKLFSVNEASLAFNTPSNQTPPLYGQLTHLRFDENPIYDALSYTWGDPKPTDKLLLRKDDLSSEQLGIAANLTKALQTLRIQDRSLFMWIDAICINQDDLDERSREVQHMHHIYSKAAIVRIWIDVENQPDDETARRLSLLSPHHDTPIKEADTGTRPKVQENSNEHSGDEDIGDRPEVWRSLSGLCKNSYWKRVWIQQEICYAADIFIHCSSASIAGEDFTEFLRQVMKKAENSSLSGVPEWGGFLAPMLVMSSNQPLFLRKARKIRPVAVDPTPRGSGSDLLTLLFIAKNSLKATDERDYFYGILSLADDFVDGKLSVQVDYRLSVVEVYTQAVNTVVRDYHTLHFLAAVDLATAQQDQGLPSWVPDWSLDSRRGHFYPTAGLIPVSANSNQSTASHFPSLSLCRRMLSVTGVRVDTILQFYKDVDFGSCCALETPVNWFAWMFRKHREISQAAYVIQNACGYESKPPTWSDHTGSPDVNLLSILRAITAFDSRSGYRFDLQECYKIFSGISDVVEALLVEDDTTEPLPITIHGSNLSISSDCAKKTQSLPSLIRSNKESATLGTIFDCVAAVPGLVGILLGQIQMMTWNRGLFVSQKGVMGVAPDTAAVGDELWFLPGCEVPILLRPEGDNYIVVGEAHINDYPFRGASANIDDAYAHACNSGESRFQRITLI